MRKFLREQWCRFRYTHDWQLGRRNVVVVERRNGRPRPVVLEAYETKCQRCGAVLSQTVREASVK